MFRIAILLGVFACLPCAAQEAYYMSVEPEFPQHPTTGEARRTVELVVFCGIPVGGFYWDEFGFNVAFSGDVGLPLSAVIPGTNTGVDIQPTNIGLGGSFAGFSVAISDAQLICVDTPIATFEVMPTVGVTTLDVSTVSVWHSDLTYGAPAVAFADEYPESYLNLLGHSTTAVPVSDFIRGDVNDDGSVDIADAIEVLDIVFLGSPTECFPAADANDDNLVNIADAVTVHGSLFTPGAPALPPPNSCGVDDMAPLVPCIHTFCP